MDPRRLVPSIAGALVCFACGRGEPAADSVSAASPDADTAWVDELGPFLAVPGDSERVALVINPSSDSIATISLGRLGAAFAPAVPATALRGDSLVCDTPTLRLRGAVPSDWTVGVGSRDVTSVPVDSIEAMTPADSSALVADVARVASALAPPDSRLRGLPFVVTKAYRITRPAGATIVATVLRRLPQEASPLEARALVVAERVASGAFDLSYGLRSEGVEDSVEHFAPLGVLRARDKEFLIIEREHEGGTRYEILERSAAAEWRVRWARALVC